MGGDFFDRKYIKVISVLALFNVLLFMLYMLYTERVTIVMLLPTLTPVSPPRIANNNDFLRDSSHNTSIDFKWLANNPVYSRFAIKEANPKKRVTILVIVSSAPRRVDRRNAVRNSWWTLCRGTAKVFPECIFLTDFQKPTDKYYKITKEEEEKYGDIYFQHVSGGVTFGLRFLNHMVFAVSRYKFDYFLRVDDDYFFCFKNFLNELPVPMVSNFHWGWVHCGTGNIVRPEESMILLSRDLIETFLLQDPKKIMCHPWADQMIGVWSNTIDLKHTWRHDNRLHHHPPGGDVPSIKNGKDICTNYIGVHGSYPELMLKLWSNRGKYKESGGDLISHSHVCPLHQPFRWDGFGNVWRYEPKLCITNPVWDTSKQFVLDGSYSGRQDEHKG